MSAPINSGIARSYLFVPGNRPERFAKALASPADAVILDLEDAVAAEAKPAARAAIAAWAGAADAGQRGRTLVRINDAASPHFAEDLRLLADLGLAQLMLPKAESAAQIATVCAAMPGGSCAVLALIESALGVAQVEAIAAAPGVQRLVFGTLDLALDLGLDIADSSEPLAYAASRIVLASRLAGRVAPVAGVTPQFDDTARLLSDLAWSRRHGFNAKLCIHPAQVAPIHDAMAPGTQELDWARQVLEADRLSPGAARLSGRMIDRPVVLLAQRILHHAKL